MEKIVLNKKQEKVLKDVVSGKFSEFFSTYDDQILFGEVIDLAYALLEETKCHDELDKKYDTDIMDWFWSKYQEQKNE